jgi:hypothetical protein
MDLLPLVAAFTEIFLRCETGKKFDERDDAAINRSTGVCVATIIALR